MQYGTYCICTVELWAAYAKQHSGKATLILLLGGKAIRQYPNVEYISIQSPNL